MRHAEPTAVVVPIQDRVRGTTEMLEADFSRMHTRIHRFPPGLRGIGGRDGRYITPTVVALGPYHHGSRPEFQEMENLKHAAAHYFCAASSQAEEVVYDKILSVADQASACYDEEDAAVARFSRSQFAEMMFLDGCFLLMYIGTAFDDDEINETTTHHHHSSLIRNVVLSTGPCLLRDIMLLENQLPWLVLETLMTFNKHVAVDVHRFIYKLREFMDLTDRRRRPRQQQQDAVVVVNIVDNNNEEDQYYRPPPHLLGLARFYLTTTVSSMPADHQSSASSSDGAAAGESSSMNFTMSSSSLLSLSAIKLSEMGVKLKKASSSKTAAWSFPDMTVTTTCCLFGELSISPLFLNDTVASWLVNMAAFEARTSTEYPSDGFHVSSYLSLLALLMDREQDVHELRARQIVTSLLSDHETLEFFKAIARHLRLGYRYFAVLSAIDKYRMERRVWIVVYSFFYGHWKTIVTLISIASVLVGIFQTLYSLKKHS